MSSSQWKYCAVSSTIETENNPEFQHLGYQSIKSLKICNYAKNCDFPCDATGYGTIRTNFADILKDSSKYQNELGLTLLKEEQQRTKIKPKQHIESLAKGGFITSSEISSSLYTATSKKIEGAMKSSRISYKDNQKKNYESISEELVNSLETSQNEQQHDTSLLDTEKEENNIIATKENSPKKKYNKTITYIKREDAVKTFIDQHQKRFIGGKPVLYIMRKNSKNCLSSYGEDEDKLINVGFDKINKNSAIDGINYIESIYYNLDKNKIK